METIDYNYELLLEYIETGANKKLSTEMVQYIETLEIMRSMYSRYESKNAIVKFVSNSPYKLSPFLANKRFAEMLNFFYANNDIKKDAWRNAYAEKLDKAAELLMLTAKKPEDLEIYIKAVKEAAAMRNLHKDDPIELPKELFQKPTKIYVINPELVGRKKANRNILAQQIDALDIPEHEKNRIKQDAMIEDIEFLEDAD